MTVEPACWSWPAVLPTEEEARRRLRVELSYEIAPGGTQHVTADVYVTVPNP